MMVGEVAFRTLRLLLRNLSTLVYISPAA